MFVPDVVMTPSFHNDGGDSGSTRIHVKGWKGGKGCTQLQRLITLDSTATRLGTAVFHAV